MACLDSHINSSHACFLSSVDFFPKSTFSRKKSFRNLSPKCLHKLSAEDNSRQNFNHIDGRHKANR